MTEAAKDELAKLDNLDPEARARVSSALKDAIEKEIAATSEGASSQLAAQFSRGVFFSRVSSLEDRAEMLTKIAAIGDEDFTRVAERLSQLRSAGERTDPQA